MHAAEPSPKPSAARRRLPAIALALAALAALALGAAPAALADTFTPESGGSPNADSIDTLYKIVFALGVLVFIGVEAVLIWSLVRYRFRRGGPPPEQIRGNAPLEISWTVAAALVLVVLSAITFVYLDDIKNPPESGPGGLQFASVDQPSAPGGDSLKIRVTGQQYLWRFDYPGRQGEGQLFSYHDLVVPEDTTVELSITSQDVIHSWWIPKLGGKADGVPGHTNETWFKASEPRTYGGWCAELCGAGHADMRARVVVLPVEEYEAWARGTRAAIARSGTLLARARRARQAGEQRGATTPETTRPPDAPQQ